MMHSDCPDCSLLIYQNREINFKVSEYICTTGNFRSIRYWIVRQTNYLNSLLRRYMDEKNTEEETG